MRQAGQTSLNPRARTEDWSREQERDEAFAPAGDADLGTPASDTRAGTAVPAAGAIRTGVRGPAERSPWATLDRPLGMRAALPLATEATMRRSGGRDGWWVLAAGGAALWTGTAAAAPLPDRVWGTYVGGDLSELNVSVAVGADGDVYLCGATDSLTSIATPGAHQDSLGGDLDAYLMRFTPAGEPVWGTYYGGAGREVCQTLVIDGDGDIILVGATTTTVGMATPGTVQPSYGGGNADGFVAKFDADGQRLWGTYVGSPSMTPNVYGVEHLEDVAVDASGAIYVSGTVHGTLPYPIPDAHDPTFGGFLMRLTQGAVDECASDRDCDGGLCIDGVCVPDGGSTGETADTTDHGETTSEPATSTGPGETTGTSDPATTDDPLTTGATAEPPETGETSTEPGDPTTGQGGCACDAAATNPMGLSLFMFALFVPRLRRRLRRA